VIEKVIIPLEKEEIFTIYFIFVSEYDRCMMAMDYGM
jgi:hypothetical protein